MPNVRVALLREVVFAALLAVAFACVTVGAAMHSPKVGWAVGGGLLTVWSVVVFADIGRDD